MAVRVRPIWAICMLAGVGCGPDPAIFGPRPNNLPMVSPGPFSSPPPVAVRQTAAKPQLPPASQDVAVRVGLVGQKMVLANKQTGLRPAFHTIGRPEAEVFHRGVSELFISEGMVKLCRTEADLAAVLSLELGKMVAEREAVAAADVRRPERLPPQDPHVGSDSGGTFGPADGTRLVELAKFEQENPRRKPSAQKLDPTVLARGYLEKAGYAPVALDEIASILKAANQNVDLERQLTGMGPATRPWN